MLITVSGMAGEVEIQKLLTAMRIDEWLNDDFLQLKWWLLLGLYVLSVLVWRRRLDRTRLPEVMLYAVWSLVLTMGIDEYGEELTLWDYPVDLVPVFPVVGSINLVALPMVYSLVYQRFRTWRSFIRAVIVVTAAISFGLEPALVWAGCFELLNWQYYYTFPVYIAVAILTRWAVLKAYAVAAGSRS